MKIDSRHQCWFGVIGLLLAAATSSAVEVRPPLENKITAALKKKIAVNFREVPLAEAVRQLAAAADVPYRVDSVAFEEEGLKTDDPITLQRAEQSIARTLAEILYPRSLTFDPYDKWLSVTTQAKKDERLNLRFFDVSRLVELIKPRLIAEPIFDDPAQTDEPFGCAESRRKREPGQGLYRGGGFGGDGAPAYERAPFRITLEDSQHRFPAERFLMTFVQEHTNGQWEEVDNVGGSMTPSPGRLLVRHTDEVQREAFVILTNLETMLSDLKKHPHLRLHESEEHRVRDAALNRVLNTISDAPAATIPLQTWIDANLKAEGLPVGVDEDVLRDEGVEWKDVTITLVPGVLRRKLFQEALDQNLIAMVYHQDQFIVTASTSACEWLTTEIYDIGDLPEAGDFDWLAEYLAETTSGQWAMYDGVGGTVTHSGLRGLLIVRQTPRVIEEITERLDDLRQPLEIPTKPLEIVRTRSIYALPDVQTATDLQAILPKLVDLPDATWPDGAIQRVGAMLIVQQPEFVHRRIEKVVDALRKAHAVSFPPPTPAATVKE